MRIILFFWSNIFKDGKVRDYRSQVKNMRASEAEIFINGNFNAAKSNTLINLKKCCAFNKRRSVTTLIEWTIRVLLVILHYRSETLLTRIIKLCLYF